MRISGLGWVMPGTGFSARNKALPRGAGGDHNIVSRRSIRASAGDICCKNLQMSLLMYTYYIFC